MKRDSVPAAASPQGTGKGAVSDVAETGLGYWISRLVHRKYLDQIHPSTARQYSARIGQAGTSCYFPLGSEDDSRAAARAAEIHRTIERKGWDFACRRYSR